MMSVQCLVVIETYVIQTIITLTQNVMTEHEEMALLVM